MHMNQSSLDIAIKNGDFFNLSTGDCLQLLKQEYAVELDWLKTAYSVPGPTSERFNTLSPSLHLYDTEFDEVNRTLVSVLSLRWIYNKDYDTFVSHQVPHIKLTRESFNWISTFFHNRIDDSSSDDIYSLITSIIINDLGKSESLITEFQRVTNINISKLNHDMILYQVVNKYPHLVPSISKLPPPRKADLILGIQLGAEFNFEPVFQAFKNVYDVSIGIIEGRLGVREAYDLNLTKRVELLINVGWEKGREFDISEPVYRAVMRLLCTTNSSDIDGADLIYDTFFEVLGEDSRRFLVQGLNSDGSLERPAAQATYIPAALAAVFRYLARTLHVDVEQVQKKLPPGVTVIERDIRRTIMDIVHSDGFPGNPDILDNVDLPNDEVANMAVGYEWIIV
ncbi:hypothetical protein TWF970_007081 [Orbilia oligospora]|uniref:Uncharacterized protein n=1 Tax=Orbilia oligospora TaxID=2813651 RepID=A0A7C8RH83_ORBOL|nr:hypothetical protein TWF970_007081 [Orbilia oligospora]